MIAPSISNRCRFPIPSVYPNRDRFNVWIKSAPENHLWEQFARTRGGRNCPRRELCQGKCLDKDQASRLRMAPKGDFLPLEREMPARLSHAARYSAIFHFDIYIFNLLLLLPRDTPRPHRVQLTVPLPLARSSDEKLFPFPP